MTMHRRIRKWETKRAERYAVATVLAAVEAAPGPEKSKHSTGRSRASVASASGDPAEYAAPASRNYKIPKKADALRGIRGRSPGQSVFVDFGVNYRDFVIPRYDFIRAGHLAGEDALATADDGEVLLG